jgi:hypothetical protein
LDLLLAGLCNRHVLHLHAGLIAALDGGQVLEAVLAG